MLMSLKRSLESMVWVADPTKYHLAQVFGSFVFFNWIANYVSPNLSEYLPAYQNLTIEKKTEWNAKMSSLTHAVIVSVGCLYILTTDEESIQDKLWGQSWISRANIAIATGYLLSDLLLMAIHFENIGGDWKFVTHHACAVYAYYYVLVYGVLSYFANFRLLAELSTPFVNIRWFLDVTEKKSSKAYLFNGIMLSVCFFLIRILLMPYYYYNVYITIGTHGFKRLGFVIQASWIGVCAMLDIMNIIWFHKIASGLMKLCKKNNLQNEEMCKKVKSN